MAFNKENHARRVKALKQVCNDFGAYEGLNMFVKNVYYLNRQYNTGVMKINKWLVINNYEFKIHRSQLTHLKDKQTFQLQLMFLYIFTGYYNKAFNLTLQPFELITYDFELLGMYINPNRKLDKRYNKVKR